MIIRYAPNCGINYDLSIIAKARIVNYVSRIIIYSFLVLATVIMIVNYDHTVITIVNYVHKTFIVQATGATDPSYSIIQVTAIWNILHYIFIQGKYDQGPVF
jgi:hypothetical protein